MAEAANAKADFSMKRFMGLLFERSGVQWIFKITTTLPIYEQLVVTFSLVLFPISWYRGDYLYLLQQVRLSVTGENISTLGLIQRLLVLLTQLYTVSIFIEAAQKRTKTTKTRTWTTMHPVSERKALPLRFFIPRPESLDDDDDFKDDTYNLGRYEGEPMYKAQILNDNPAIGEVIDDVEKLVEQYNGKNIVDDKQEEGENEEISLYDMMKSFEKKPNF